MYVDHASIYRTYWLIKNHCYSVAVGGKVDASSLSQLIVKRVRELKTSADQLKDALQVFDKQGTGLISVQDLKLSLTSLGEPLTKEQLDELIREVDQDGEGMVNADGNNAFSMLPWLPFFHVSSSI